MDLKSMKLSSPEMTGALPSEAPAIQYPYGLRIELSSESIQKLGIESLPAVGEVKMVHAKVIVERVSQNETMDGEKRKDISLQITDMCICDSEEEKESESVEKKLYKTDGSRAVESKSQKTLLVDI